MTQEMMPKQKSFDTAGFEINKDLIMDISNREAVVDFFGDNRTLYDRLVRGGATYPRTFLTSEDSFDTDLRSDDPSNEDLLPLDPSRINEGRAENIVKFFEEYPDAKESFIAYYKWYSRPSR